MTEISLDSDNNMNFILKVRKAACSSLGRFSSLYIKFACETLDLLMDMLNDDYEVVQLQALETLLKMANDGFMFLEERHMEMVCYFAP